MMRCAVFILLLWDTLFLVNNVAWALKSNGALPPNPLLPTPAHYVQPFPMADCKGKRLEDASIDQIQAWYDSKDLSIRDVVSCYLTRIEQVDVYVK